MQTLKYKDIHRLYRHTCSLSNENMMEQNSNSIFLFLERANYQPNTDFYWFPYNVLENFNLNDPKKFSTDFSVKYEWGKTITLVAFRKHCSSPCWRPSHASSLHCSVIISDANTCMSLPERFSPWSRMKCRSCHVNIPYHLPLRMVTPRCMFYTISSSSQWE